MAIFQGKKVFVVVPCGFLCFFFSPLGQTSYIPFIEKVSLETSIQSKKWTERCKVKARENVNEDSEFFQSVVRFLY